MDSKVVVAQSDFKNATLYSEFNKVKKGDAILLRSVYNENSYKLNEIDGVFKHKPCIGSRFNLKFSRGKEAPTPLNHKCIDTHQWFAKVFDRETLENNTSLKFVEGKTYCTEVKPSSKWAFVPNIMNKTIQQMREETENEINEMHRKRKFNDDSDSESEDDDETQKKKKRKTSDGTRENPITLNN